MRNRKLPAKDSPIQVRLLADSTFELLYSQYEYDLVQRLMVGCCGRIETSQFVLDLPQTSQLTRQHALQHLGAADWLHVCGHGKVDQSNLRGWEFVDGVLTTSDLRDAACTVPEFIFANVCGSAEMPHEELPVRANLEVSRQDLTLMEQLIGQGCRYFLGTMVPIRDNQCLPFVETFYKQILNAMAIGESVRQARLRTIQELGETNLMWASFSLIGDPRDQLLPTASPAESSLFRVDRVVSPAVNVPMALSKRESSSGEEGSVEMIVETSQVTNQQPVLQFPIPCQKCGAEIRTRHGIGAGSLHHDASDVLCRVCVRQLRATVQQVATSTNRDELNRVTSLEEPLGIPLAAAQTSQKPAPEEPSSDLDTSRNAASPPLAHQQVETTPVEAASATSNRPDLSESQRSTATYEIQYRKDKFRRTWKQSVERCQQIVDPLTRQILTVKLSQDEVMSSGIDQANQSCPFANEWLVYRVSRSNPKAQSRDVYPKLYMSMVEGFVESVGPAGLPKPLGLKELTQVLSQLPNATRAECQIVGVVAAYGWDDSARRFAAAKDFQGHLEPDRSLILVDLVDDSRHFIPHDLRLIPWLPLFDPEDDATKVERIRNDIQRRLPLEVSVSAAELCEIVPASEEVALQAMRQMAVRHRLHLDYVEPFGWVLS